MIQESETVQLIKILAAAYPQQYRNLGKDELESMKLVWRVGLEDITYLQAQKGLLQFIKNDTKGFPPSPGQIINSFATMIDDDSVLNAWEEIYKAASNSGTYERADIQFRNLSKALQYGIGSVRNLALLATADEYSIKTQYRPEFIERYKHYTSAHRSESINDPASMIENKQPAIGTSKAPEYIPKSNMDTAGSEHFSKDIESIKQLGFAEFMARRRKSSGNQNGS